MYVKPMDLEVVGWVDRHTGAHAVVAHLSFWGRFGRASAAAALVWMAAIPLMFVPFLVILVLPTAIALSAYLFAVRMRAPDVAKLVEGTCPDCGHRQRFDVPEQFAPPVEIECQKCSRELWLTEHEGGLAAALPGR